MAGAALVSVLTGIVEGPTGAQGAQGPMGPAGTTGEQGLAGPTGVAGSQGEQGLAGPVGTTGAQGERGQVGSIGATGARGEPGFVGPAGATGFTGATGPQGVQGSPGSPGPLGPLNLLNEFGPTAGALAHDPTANTIKTQSTGVELSDVMVEARFFNPYSPSVASWSYGFMFRNSSANMFHSVIVRSDGQWQHNLRTGSVESSVLVESATSSHIDTGADRSNHIRVFALGGEGWLYINGGFVAKLDLSGLMDAGNAAAGTGFFVGDEVAGESTRFVDFTVSGVS